MGAAIHHWLSWVPAVLLAIVGTAVAAAAVWPDVKVALDPIEALIMSHWGLALALSLAACLLWYVAWRHTSPKATSGASHVGDTYNNSGNIFGHMGPVNNYGPQKLNFTPEVGAELLTYLTEKKPIILRTVGSDADQIVGSDFQRFLETSGYAVQRHMIGMLAPPPSRKVEIGNAPDHYVVTISPSL